MWLGVELGEPKGKNGGSVHGKVYFECNKRCGLFVHPRQLFYVSSAVD